jgi:hypothetical protein
MLTETRLYPRRSCALSRFDWSASPFRSLPASPPWTLAGFSCSGPRPCRHMVWQDLGNGPRPLATFFPEVIALRSR